MAAETIRVHVVKYPNRDNLVMRYRCPLTRKQVAKSTGTTKRKEAEKVAAKWEADLQAGRYAKDSRMSWEDFREFWGDSREHALRAGSFETYQATLNLFERYCRPERVSDLTTARVTAFLAELRKERTRKNCKEKYRLSEATVARHLRHLRSIAKWAAAQGLLPTAPAIEMPSGAEAGKMKGRPITGEEFDRMLEAVAGVVGPNAAESWRTLLLGLWWSGLRLSEALALRWDHQPGAVSVVLEKTRSHLEFDHGSQKSGRVESAPLAPEAVEFLEPLYQRSGFVFSPIQPGAADGRLVRDSNQASRVISRIGAAARITTDPARGKTASAHDLRRAFGVRWSKRIMPAQLKQLMRHAKIETTLQYYAREAAADAAEGLWEALGSIQGNTEREPAPRK